MSFDRLDPEQRDAKIFAELREIRALLEKMFPAVLCPHVASTMFSQEEMAERLNPKNFRRTPDGKLVTQMFQGKICGQVVTGEFTPLQGVYLEEWERDNQPPQQEQA